MNARVTVTVEVTDNHGALGEVVVAAASLVDECMVGIVGADPETMDSALREAILRAGNTALGGALNGAATTWTFRARKVEKR